MKKTIHIAKAHILKHKSATMSLFAIIMIVSLLATTGMSVILGAAKDFKAGRDRLNSLHSAIAMDKGKYNPAFEEIIRGDPRVSQYDIGEVLCPKGLTVDYGGEVELMYASLIFPLSQPAKLSIPKITEQDPAIPHETAIYLPAYSKEFGFSLGDPFTMTYRNRQIQLTVAAFFETSEFGNVTDLALKFFAPDECYEMLAGRFARAVWIAVRFHDESDSASFNADFARETDMELSSFALACDAGFIAAASVTPVSMFSAIVVIFASLLALISMIVIRFRVSNSIENAMHEIGALKASGYTSPQIIRCYMAEYAIISCSASLLGVLLSIPVFPAIRRVLTALSGTTWTLGANVAAGGIAALLVTATLLAMIQGSCRKIKGLPPVAALRGGPAANSFRRNYFPLHRGAGSVHMRLGFKSMFAFFKTYASIGFVMAGISLAVIFLAVTFQNFVFDHESLAKMTGYELSDVNLVVARHTDADALAAHIEQMPQVRRTSMLDFIGFDVGGIPVEGTVSSDFGRLESMSAGEGRFPKYDNEVALPKIMAARLGKEIGDSVSIRANSVSQEYVITGFYSVTSNGGRMAAITLEGYQRLDPNYRRGNINVYLEEGADFEEFSGLLKQIFGVLNVYRQDGDGRFSEAKARAEEKISNYLEYYRIDSVEYAVIYNGEIILSGTSGAYQIEKIIDFREVLEISIGALTDTVALITQVVAVISLIVISLILSMTIRSIVAKRRRELGTLKAIGFTTKQLARQLAVSFMPMATIGTILGCIGGAALVNPAFNAMLKSEGILNATFTIDPLLISLVGAMIIAVTFVVANASAMRIKKISAYELLSE